MQQREVGLSHIAREPAYSPAAPRVCKGMLSSTTASQAAADHGGAPAHVGQHAAAAQAAVPQRLGAQLLQLVGTLRPRLPADVQLQAVAHSEGWELVGLGQPKKRQGTQSRQGQPCCMDVVGRQQAQPQNEVR